MPLFLDQGIFALGVAVGVPGLVLARAGALSAIVAASFRRVNLDILEARVSRALLVAGSAWLSGLLLWPLQNRQATPDFSCNRL